MSNRRLSTYIDAIVAGRRPPRYRADPEDVEVLQTAIALRAARPGDGEPDDEFVSDLFNELVTQGRSAPIVELAHPRRRRALLAAVAASVVIVGGTVLATDAINHSPAPPATALAPSQSAVRTGTFETADNQVMGQIVAYSGHPSWVYMNVNGSNFSGRIVCKLQIQDGSAVAVGVFDLHHGKGEFSRNITVDISHLRGAKLVTSTGSTVAMATFA
ncbi:MAG: hypothetical protein JWO62_1239 [Acidimicrobiaceae bacterium]|nr:hypothetical protein [Acidimicrobiaceae bacterium]